MRRRRTTISWTLIAITAVFGAACSGPDDAPLDLPETPALVGQGRYALVTEQYVRFHEEPDVAAVVIAHRRAGDVLEMMGTTADEEWTELRTDGASGWVQSIHIRRFASRRQATNAQRFLEE
ncbi:MAG: hypothetical protein ACOCU4_00710 [Alkalispirochaeta sp.]